MNNDELEFVKRQVADAADAAEAVARRSQRVLDESEALSARIREDLADLVIARMARSADFSPGSFYHGLLLGRHEGEIAEVLCHAIERRLASNTGETPEQVESRYMARLRQMFNVWPRGSDAIK